jgi:hypothetical protein
MDFFELHSKAVLKMAQQGPGSYTDSDMNQAVMSLPPAEYFARAEGKNLKDLPVADTAEDVEDYIGQCMTWWLESGVAPIPTLLSSYALTYLDTFPAWKQLYGFMSNMGLEPIFVFHNQPFRRGPLTVYAADLRLVYRVGYILEDEPERIAYPGKTSFNALE